MQCSVASAHVIEPDKRVCERKIPDVVFRLFLQRHEAHVHKRRSCYRTAVETVERRQVRGRWTVSAGSTWFCMIGRMALWMKYDTASMPASCPPVTGSP